MVKILLVDRSATDRRLLTGILEREQVYEVVAVESENEAIVALRTDEPKVVVWRTSVPAADGIQLIDDIRAGYSHVPVLVVSDPGAHDVVEEALRHGAVDYVPLANLGDRLASTVELLRNMLHGDPNYNDLLTCATKIVFEHSLENKISLIEPLTTLTARMIGGLEVGDETFALQAAVALDNAITNAMLHGNLELRHDDLLESPAATLESNMALDRLQRAPYCDRRVHVSVEVTPTRAQFIVRDEGTGFQQQPWALNDDALPRIDEAGKGLFLMRSLMDSVTYNETGNEVTLIKRKRIQHGQAANYGNLRSSARTISGDQLDLGQLIPRKGGSAIPLMKNRLTIGRDASCDIPIKSHSVSMQHCALYVFQGWWYVRDLHSTNGIRVNGVATSQHLLRPGSVLRIGSVDYEIQYEPFRLGAQGIEPPEE